MLHAISMPQSPSSSIYVQETFLVYLTPIEFESCGQPLPRYPAGEYELYCSESDRRCRSRTESGDFRSFRGKIPTMSGRIDGGLVDQQNRKSVAHRIHPLHDLHFNASGFVFTSSSLLHAGQTTRSRRSWGIVTGRLYDG